MTRSDSHQLTTIVNKFWINQEEFQLKKAHFPLHLSQITFKLEQTTQAVSWYALRAKFFDLGPLICRRKAKKELNKTLFCGYQRCGHNFN